MSKMSQLHAHLNELGPIPEYPDDSDAPAGTCDVCNEPGTEDRPVVRSVACGIETFAHGDHSETF